MKKLFISLVSLVLFASLTSCVKQSVDCGLVPAKILRYDCDRVILQILSAENIGDSNWTDFHTGVQYQNVVSNFRICRIWNMFMHEGDTTVKYGTIYLSGIKKATENSDEPECIQCTAISDNPPQTMIDYNGIFDKPCDNSELAARR